MRLARLGHSTSSSACRLCDLQIAVSLLTLEIMMQINEVFIQALVWQGEFLWRMNTSPGIMASRMRRSNALAPESG